MPPKTIAITICATKSYLYAMPALLRALQKNIYALRTNGYDSKIVLILIGSPEIEAWRQPAGELLPGATVMVIKRQWVEGENYKHHAQLTIAQMRSLAFENARSHDADFCWSIDSDVLPPPNALLCSLQMLAFDACYYSIACCPYVSQGGGLYLTGRGDPHNPIFQDFNMFEREVPLEIQEEWDAITEQLTNDPANQQLHESRHALAKKINDTCSPKFGGDIWKLIAEFGWRRRGWYDFAYPAIGKGAVVPVDWAGFGCTLMDRRALAAADFTGYDGEGTEDLFVIRKRWIDRHDLRLCSIPHCPCDHIIRVGPEKKLIHAFAYHELTGEAVGHLRTEYRPWYQHTADEHYDPANDGKFPNPVEQVEATD